MRTRPNELESVATSNICIANCFRLILPKSPTVQIDGKSYLNFSSNDYLGLANDPALKKAAIEAIEKFGAGSGASRLISGSLAPHHVLEQKLAAFKKTEAALTFSSGYAAAVGTICALVDHNDVVDRRQTRARVHR